MNLQKEYEGYAEHSPATKVRVFAFWPRGAELKTLSLLKHMRVLPRDADRKIIKVEEVG